MRKFENKIKFLVPANRDFGMEKKSNMKMFVFLPSKISKSPESFHLLHISDLLSVNKSNVNISTERL